MNPNNKVFFAMVHFKVEMEGTCTVVAENKEQAAEKITQLFANRDDVTILEIISSDEAPDIVSLVPDMQTDSNSIN